MISLPTLQFFDDKKILVLGASGFIGRSVARKLAQIGVEPVLAVRDRASFSEIRARWQLKGPDCHLDVTEEQSVRTALEAIKPDLVFNLVGYGIDRSEKNESLAKALNSDFPGFLAECLCNMSSSGGPRLIHVGSALEYGELATDLAEISTGLAPTSLYGRTKLAGTASVRQAREQGLDTVVARLFTVYGPGEHTGRLLPTLKRASIHGGAVDLSDGMQLRDFADVDQVATALVALAALPNLEFGTVNLATGKLSSVREFILTAAQILNLPQEHLNFGVVPRYADEMQHEPVNVERCCAMLGAPLSADMAGGLKMAIRFEEERA